MSDIEKYVEDAVNGDSEAFARLYELSKRQVYFTCLKFLKNEQDAQDITQEVYITVMKKLPTLTDKSSFQAWINRIAVNKCKNYLKARHDVSLDEMQEDDNYPEIPDDDILPEDYVILIPYVLFPISERLTENLLAITQFHIKAKSLQIRNTSTAFSLAMKKYAMTICQYTKITMIYFSRIWVLLSFI